MGCGSVDPVRQTSKLYALLVKFTDQIDEPFDRSTQAIELPHHEDIALA
jgi:hypothetical protein